MNAETQKTLGIREGFMPLPPEFDSVTGPAIVLGSAPGWLEDLDRALEITDHEAPIFAVNYTVHFSGLAPVDHAVSTHCAEKWFPAERGQTVFHANKPERCCKNVDVRWPLCGVAGTGSSALMAVVIALLMGHGPVYVAGVALTAKEVRMEGERRFVHDYRVYREGWEKLSGYLRGRVVSVSPRGNWLRELLNGEE